jgi:hypothetical protein
MVTRSGVDRFNKMSMDAQLQVRADSLSEESWQKRATFQPNTRYALGAMQEVSPNYTRISIETAERVGRQLDAALTGTGLSVEFRLLSVAAKGVSCLAILGGQIPTIYTKDSNTTFLHSYSRDLKWILISSPEPPIIYAYSR